MALQIGGISLANQVFHMVRTKRFIALRYFGSVHNPAPHLLLAGGDCLPVHVHSGGQLDGDGERFHKIGRGHPGGVHDGPFYKYHRKEQKKIHGQVNL